MKVFRSLLIVPAFVILALSASCVTFATGDDRALVGLEPEYKADLFVSVGAAAYRRDLEQAEDLARAAEVRKYFEVALRYDPTDEEASRYLALVEEYRTGRFEAAVQAADAVLAKDVRNDDDTYILLVSTRQARALFPEHEATLRLVAATKGMSTVWVQSGLDTLRLKRAVVVAGESAKARQQRTIEAYSLAQRILSIDPYNKDAIRERDNLRAELMSGIEESFTEIEQLMTKGSFTASVQVVSSLRALDESVGNAFKADIDEAEYKLYLAWASYHESRKDYPNAAARVAQALAVKKGEEALALQKRVAGVATTVRKTQAFDTALADVDRLIAARDLVAAYTLVTKLIKEYKAADQAKALDERKARITGTLPTYYETGTQAYRKEQFKDAIAALEIVVGIDPKYRDAADYLSKAREKQKLLDQY